MKKVVHILLLSIQNERRMEDESIERYSRVSISAKTHTLLLCVCAIALKWRWNEHEIKHENNNKIKWNENQPSKETVVSLLFFLCHDERFVGCRCCICTWHRRVEGEDAFNCESRSNETTSSTCKLEFFKIRSIHAHKQIRYSSFLYTIQILHNHTRYVIVWEFPFFKKKLTWMSYNSNSERHFYLK